MRKESSDEYKLASYKYIKHLALIYLALGICLGWLVIDTDFFRPHIDFIVQKVMWVIFIPTAAYALYLSSVLEKLDKELNP